MFRAVLVFIAVAAVTGGDNGNKEKCNKLLAAHAIDCCSEKVFRGLSAELKECWDMPIKPPPSCERELCIAKTRGFLKADDSLDREALESLLAKEMEDEPEILKTIKETCIDGDIDKYAPSDACEVMKMGHCIKLNFILQCPNPSSKAECQDIKELAEECFAMIS